MQHPKTPLYGRTPNEPGALPAEKLQFLVEWLV